MASSASSSSIHEPGWPPPSQAVLSMAHYLKQVLFVGVIFTSLISTDTVCSSDTFVRRIIFCFIGYFIMVSLLVLWQSDNQRDITKEYALQMLACVIIIADSLMTKPYFNSSCNTEYSNCSYLTMLLTVCTLLDGLLSLISPKLFQDRLMKILTATYNVISSFVFCIILKTLTGTHNPSDFFQSFMNAFFLVPVVLFMVIPLVIIIMDCYCPLLPLKIFCLWWLRGSKI